MLQKILLKIEPHLPTQYKEIATHFSYTFSLRVAQQIIGFISFFFIVKYIPQDLVGHYYFVLSVIGLISITSLPGMRTALMQAIARGNNGFFKTAIRYCFIGATLGSVILFLIAAYYFWKQDLTMAIAFVIAGLLNPATKGFLSWKTSYSGQERFKALAILDAAGTLITSLFLMFSVLFYTQTYIILLTIALAVPAIQNLVLTLKEYQKFKNENQTEDGLCSYGLKSSAYNILPILSTEIDKLSIYNFTSASELALYNVAMKIPEAFKIIIRNIGTVIMPKLARTSTYSDRLDKYFTMVSVGILILILLLSATILNDIFYFLTPASYHDGLIYAQALLVTFAIGNFGFLKGRYIYSQKNINSHKQITLASNLIKILFMPISVFCFQIWGAILVIFFQRLFISIYINFIINKYHKPSKD